MFGKRTRQLESEISKLAVEIEKIKVQMDNITQNVRSVRGQVNRRMKNTLDGEDEDEQSETTPEMDAATLQRNLLGFK